jgi:hypothetical protein
MFGALMNHWQNTAISIVARIERSSTTINNALLNLDYDPFKSKKSIKSHNSLENFSIFSLT